MKKLTPNSFLVQFSAPAPCAAFARNLTPKTLVWRNFFKGGGGRGAALFGAAGTSSAPAG